MKKILLFFALFSIATMATAQIKINPSGNVYIGAPDVTWVGCPLKINYGGSSFTFFPNLEKRIFFGGYNLNQSTTRVEFWHPVAEWNKIRIKGYDLSSDLNFKTDIMLIENATALLHQINTYSYFFKSDSLLKSDTLDLRQRDYGVIAQEIKEVLPELVDTCKGAMFVNYNAFIGILIAGFNEQQSVIENHQNAITALQKIVFTQEQDILELKTLQKAFYDLQQIIYDCCEKPKGTPMLTLPEEPLPTGEIAILYQNAPNPFTSNTEISCYLPESAMQATLFIYNLQGAQLLDYFIIQAGLSTVTVYGSELPAGMYLYTLVVDHEIIDTKRMILTK